MVIRASSSTGAGHLKHLKRGSDAQLVQAAAARHLVLALEEITDLGLTRRAVEHRVALGRLHRVHRRVYAIVPPDVLPARGRYRAAVLACTGSRHAAALSHRSGGDLRGLRQCDRRTVEVIVPGRSTHRHAGIQLHRSVNLAPHDIEIVDGLPVTTVSRTMLDLAAVVPARGVERALDQAEILRVFDLHALLDQLERNPAHPGAGRLRAILARYEIGSAVTESELEEALVGFFRAHGFPMPELHAAIDPCDGGVLLRPDASWRRQRVALEVDGERVHRTHRAFHDDRVRDQRLVAAGWRVIRTTWWQLTQRPHELAAILRRVLGA